MCSRTTSKLGSRSSRSLWRSHSPIVGLAGSTDMAEEQAALRRVATLVARGVPATQVFEAVIEEVGRLVGADGATLARWTRPISPLRSWAPGARAAPPYPRGALPARERNRALARFRNAAACSDGQLRGRGWPGSCQVRESAGVRRLPLLSSLTVTFGVLRSSFPKTQHRCRSIPKTAWQSSREPLATAIANAESRRSLAALAEQESALRRVATSVAERRGASSNEVFAAVAEEVAEVLHLTERRCVPL